MRNYTNLTSGTDLTAFLRFSNEVTNNYFGILIMVTPAIIAFIAMKPFYPNDKVFAASIFITMVWSLFLRWLNVVADKWVIMCIVLTGLAAVILLFNNR